MNKAVQAHSDPLLLAVLNTIEDKRIMMFSCGTWILLRIFVFVILTVFYSFVLFQPFFRWCCVFCLSLLHRDDRQGYPLRFAGDALGGLRLASVGGFRGRGPIMVRQ